MNTYAILKTDGRLPESELQAFLTQVPEIVRIVIKSRDRTVGADPNGRTMAPADPRLALGPPHKASELSGKPAYVYKTNQVELHLTDDELGRIIDRSLTPTEFFALKAKHGVFFEIHDDFYDPETGQALQPAGLFPEDPGPAQ